MAFSFGQSYHVISVCAFSALTLLVGWQEGHQACKKWGDGGGGHWLVWMQWRPWSQKKGCKTVVVWWWWYGVQFDHQIIIDYKMAVFDYQKNI